jgi:hypothetical protein
LLHCDVPVLVFGMETEITPAAMQSYSALARSP